MIQNCKFLHVGYTVGNIESSISVFSELGYSAGEKLYDERLQVEICILRKDGAADIELIHQLNHESLEAKLLERTGVMPYHIAFQPSDFDASCKDLLAIGFKELFEPVAVGALGGKRICYFWKQEVGYIEIIE